MDMAPRLGWTRRRPSRFVDALLRYSDGVDLPEVRIVFMPAADGRNASVNCTRACAREFGLHHTGAFVVRVEQGAAVNSTCFTMYHKACLAIRRAAASRCDPTTWH
jgi:hypothetical protein